MMCGALALAALASAAALAQETPAPSRVPPPEDAATGTPQKPAKPARPAKKKKAPLPPIPLEPLRPVPLTSEPAAGIPGAEQPAVTGPPTQIPAAPVELSAPAPAAAAPIPEPRTAEEVVPVRPAAPAQQPAGTPRSDSSAWRRLTVFAAAGLWAKSHSDAGSRTWDAAYGLSVGWDFWPGLLEAELQVVRAGGSSGSAFANAEVTHNLFALRAFLVLGGPRLSLLLGGGGGLALVQTRYFILDPANLDASGRPQAQTLDATSGAAVWQPAAVLRARMLSGLTLRAEVTALVRGGRLEPMPLFGLGWAF